MHRLGSGRDKAMCPGTTMKVLRCPMHIHVIADRSYCMYTMPSDMIPVGAKQQSTINVDAQGNNGSVAKPVLDWRVCDTIQHELFGF